MSKRSKRVHVSVGPRGCNRVVPKGPKIIQKDSKVSKGPNGSKIFRNCPKLCPSGQVPKAPKRVSKAPKRSKRTRQGLKGPKQGLKRVQKGFKRAPKENQRIQKRIQNYPKDPKWPRLQKGPNGSKDPMVRLQLKVVVQVVFSSWASGYERCTGE